MRMLTSAMTLLGVAWVLIDKGVVKLPLYYPAVGMYAHVTPPYVHPWKSRPSEGVWAGSHVLNATRLFEGHVRGSESVTMGPDGRFVMLDKYGDVFEAHEGPNGDLVLNHKPVAYLGTGRPLGAKFDEDGNLIICDSLKGLMMLENGTRKVVVLANRVSKSSLLDPDTPIIYPNDLDISRDGTIWFTASVDIYPHRSAQYTSKVWHIPSLVGQPGFYDTLKGWGMGCCQGLPMGRLMKYDPVTKQVHVVAKGFWYANGVALSEDESYVAVSETDRLRVMKLWLKGPKAGTQEVLVDALPGPPDGISRSSDGNYWVPMVTKVPPVSRYFGLPAFRALLAWMPETWRPEVPVWGAVLKVTPEGEPVLFLLDEQGQSASKIPSAHEEHGRLYFGNLATDFVSYIKLEDLEAMRRQAPTTPGQELQGQ